MTGLQLTMRFDMRAPEFGASPGSLYPAAYAMAEWADQRGFSSIGISEHHATEDGYCPAPLVLGSAIAARTQHVKIRFGVMLLTLHHPLRAAEEIAVLDNISEGRIVPMFGAGYRMEEFEMFGVDPTKRAKLMEEGITAMKEAWKGEWFEFQGNKALVRPRPYQDPHPPIHMGGSIESTARLAARIADDFFPSTVPLVEVFQAERERLGKPRVPGKNYGAKGSWFIHVTEDPEKAWDTIAPHAIHESNTYTDWATQRKGASMFGMAGMQDENNIRENAKYVVITPDECIAMAHEHSSVDGSLGFAPLMGGLDPDFAWASLELFDAKVLPEIHKAGLLAERSN
jgi:alkanesulfonate monooxygenase SsuD/methylene tetrahydromethanopterin reductase-like flavin-dependent oxidoreductase (luciferase family)